MSIWLARDPMVVQRAKEYHCSFDPVLAAEANSRFKKCPTQDGKTSQSFIFTNIKVDSNSQKTAYKVNILAI